MVATTDQSVSYTLPRRRQASVETQVNCREPLILLHYLRLVLECVQPRTVGRNDKNDVGRSSLYGLQHMQPMDRNIVCPLSSAISTSPKGSTGNRMTFEQGR